MRLAGVLALIEEPLAGAIDNDAVRDRSDASDDTAIEFRSACVHRDHVSAAGIANRFCASIEQQTQHRAGVMGRAADHEIIGGSAEALAEPIETGLMSTRAHHQRFRDGALGLAVMANVGGAMRLAAKAQRHNFAIIADADTELYRGGVECVDHRLATAEKKSGSSRIGHRTARRVLQPCAVVTKP